MNRFTSSIAFLGAIVIGFILFVSRFNYEQKRSTASIKNNYDLTCLSGEDFKKAVVNRVVTGFKAIRRDGMMGFSIGHYTFSDSEEDKKSACAENQDRSISSAFNLISKKMACELYPQIRYSFVADGESSNGDKRRLEVEAPCTVSADMSRTEVVWVPWKQLSLETPFEGVSQYVKPSRATVKTSHITDKWPEKWVLDQIEISGEHGSVTVGEHQIREIMGRPVVLEFN